MSSENLATVSFLQTRKPDAQTYRDFHELYGVARNGAAILLNRVLHIDETNDRSMHLIVTQQKMSGGLMVPIPECLSNETPRYKVGYNPMGTLIATTDGETITKHHTRSVHGIYQRSINRRYHPIFERLYVDFVSPQGNESGRAEFNLGTGGGNFSIGSRVLGWILGSQESDYLRHLAVTSDIVAPLQGTVAS